MEAQPSTYSSMSLTTETTHQLIQNELPAHARVLSVACGHGDCLFQLSSFIKRGIGIDSSETMIESALLKKRKKKVHNLYFLRMREELIEENIPGEFDVALSWISTTEKDKLEQRLLQMKAKAKKVILASMIDACDDDDIAFLLKEAGLRTVRQLINENETAQIWVTSSN